jgi:hypothetical protein
MIRILQSLLVLFSLLALAFVAAKANSAPLADADGQSPTIGPAVSSGGAVFPRLHMRHRHVFPGPQAGTHLQPPAFAYGYFGAHAPTTAAFHTNNRGDWYQWTFTRAD